MCVAAFETAPREQAFNGDRGANVLKASCRSFGAVAQSSETSRETFVSRDSQILAAFSYVDRVLKLPEPSLWASVG